MTVELGTLVAVPLKEIWAREDSDFTLWLAKSSNLEALGDALGIRGLELNGTEVPMGNFFIDILGEDVEGNVVVIENQFGSTNHTHLGQIMTYVGGQEGAVTVVWIAETFRDEHRAAIDWLNGSTAEHHNFFAVEVEALKIGDSMPAPRFDVVGKPNNWSRGVARRTREVGAAQLTERHKFYMQYWSEFSEFLSERKSWFKVTANYKDYWCGFRLGRASVQFAATANARDKVLGAELYIGRNDDKALFRALKAESAEIEQVFGERLDWQELPDKTASRIAVRLEADPSDPAARKAQFEWMADKLERFHRAFYDRVRELTVELDSSGDAQNPVTSD